MGIDAFFQRVFLPPVLDTHPLRDEDALFCTVATMWDSNNSEIKADEYWQAPIYQWLG